MATFHCSVSRVSRSDGRSATAAAAYRAGCMIRDERTGNIYDYRYKQGVEASVIFAPSWAQDPSILWNAAERAERRKDSKVAREMTLSLPHELPIEERCKAAMAMACWLREEYGVAVQCDVHAPHRNGDKRNTHAHLLFTTRVVGEEGFSAKTRQLDKSVTARGEIIKMRRMWAKIANINLEDNGLEERIDHRSHEARGIEVPPTVKLGPAASALERRGVRTHYGDWNRGVRQLANLIAERDALYQWRNKIAGITDDEHRVFPDEDDDLRPR